jgi:hypothetical protein
MNVAEWFIRGRLLIGPLFSAILSSKEQNLYEPRSEFAELTLRLCGTMFESQSFKASQ